MNRIALMIASCVLSGCFSAALRPRPRAVWQRTVPFDPAAYQPYGATGTAAIEGQAFVNTEGGDTKKCAGRPVQLFPSTAYSDEWFEHVVLYEEDISAGDPRAAKYQHTATGDADGRFTFEGLPGGSYYVVCSIVWKVPHTSCVGTVCASGLESTGGTAYKKVTVADGQRLRNVVVTR